MIIKRIPLSWLVAVSLLALAGCGSGTDPRGGVPSVAVTSPSDAPVIQATGDSRTALGLYMLTTGANQLPEGITARQACARLFGPAASTAEKVGLKPPENYTVYAGPANGDGAKCLLNPMLGEAGGRTEVWFGITAYRPGLKSTLKMGSGECLHEPSEGNFVFYGCRSGAWKLETVVVNRVPENPANGIYAPGSAEGLIDSLFAEVSGELETYPTNFRAPTPTPQAEDEPEEEPTPSDIPPDSGQPEDCSNGFSGFSRLAKCRVEGRTALQVLEACRAAARYFVWAQSNGTAGSISDDIGYDTYDELSVICLKGAGMKVTDISMLSSCPKGCTARDGRELEYILLRGDVDGDLVPALFSAETGTVVDNTLERAKLHRWVQQFEH